MTEPENNRKRVGAKGELLVKLHLERQGWRVPAMNFRCAQGEMDLIAEEPTPEGSVLVFVEVKTRRGRLHGAGAEAVDARKQRKLIGIAQAYLARRDAGGEEPACRFDVAEVKISADGLAQISLHRAFFMDE